MTTSSAAVRFVASLAASAMLAGHAVAQRAEVWVEGLTKPVDMVEDPTSPGRFLVVEQGGEIREIRDGSLESRPVFRVNRRNFVDRNWEQGLLGIALDPNFAENRRVYLNYTGRGGTTHISRFTQREGGTIDPGSEQVILTIDQPYGNHNGGAIRFGPDNMLWIGTGDGGAANDPHGYGQDPDTLLGKMLRLDVTSRAENGQMYVIPSDNPFLDDDDYRPEIWATGLRNPWRYEWDTDGTLWIADVGQNRWAEISIEPANSPGGLNYGWAIMEGLGEFRAGNRRRDDPPALEPADHIARGLVPPMWQYRHHPTGSITGGYVYRGERVESLKGRYIYADFMSGRVWSLVLRNGRADDVVEHTRDFAPAFEPNGAGFAIGSFAQDRDRELYILDHKGGRVMRIIE